MVLLAVNYSSTVAILLTEKNQHGKVFGYQDEWGQLPSIEATEDFSEDKVRGVFFCQFPILSKNELTLIRNVDKFQSEDGSPLQIPPMPRIMVAAGQGSVLSRGIKDCREDFLLPNGSRIKDIKMKQPADSIFKSSNITVMTKKIDSPSIFESVLVNTNETSKDTTAFNMFGDKGGINKEPLKTGNEGGISNTEGKTTLFVSKLLESKVDEKKPAILPTSVGLPDTKKASDVFKPENKTPLKLPEKSPSLEIGSGTKLKFGEVHSDLSSPPKKFLAPVKQPEIPIPAKVPVQPIKPDSKVQMPTPAQLTKPSTAPPADSSAQQPISYATAADAFRAVKMDNQLKKLDFKASQLSKLENLFNDIDRTLKERPDCQGYTIGRLPPGAFEKTEKTALDSLKRDKDNLTKCRNEISNLKQISKDTEKLAAIISANDTPVGRSFRVASFLEHIHEQNESKVAGLRQTIKSLENVENNVKQFADLIAYEDSFISRSNVSQNDPKKGNLSSLTSQKGATSSLFGKSGSNCGDSFFFTSANGSLFGSKNQPKGTSQPNWSAFSTPTSEKSNHIDQEQSSRVRGTMIDRITTEKSNHQNSFLKKSSNKPPAPVNDRLVRSSFGNQSETKVKESLRDYFDRFFTFKASTVTALEKRLLHNQTKARASGGVMFDLSSLADDSEIDQSFRLQSRVEEGSAFNLFSKDADKKINVNEQKMFLNTLAAKQLKVRHCLDISLRNKLMEEQEAEERRQARTIDEQDAKLRKFEAKKQATITEAQSKPLGDIAEKIGFGAVKTPENKSSASVPAPTKAPESTLLKADPAGTQDKKVLGGIFGGPSKASTDLTKDQPIVQQSKDKPAEEGMTTDTKPGLFSGAAAAEGSSNLFSGGGLGALGDNKKTTNATGDQEKKDTTKSSLFGVPPKDDGQAKTSADIKLTSALLGSAEGLLDRSGGVFGSFVMDKDNNVEKIEEKDDDEEEDSGEGPSLQHTTSQIGESKTASRQTNPMSKAVSNAEGPKQGKPDQKSSSPEQKTQPPSGGLFGSKEPILPQSTSLFSLDKPGSSISFARMANDSKADNIFGQMHSQKKDEPKETFTDKPIAGGIFSKPPEKAQTEDATKKKEEQGSQPLFPKESSQSAPQTGLGIFGQKPPVQTSSGQSGGLFDAKPGAQGMNSQSGGIFGGPKEPTTGPQAGGLFSTPVNTAFNGTGTTNPQSQGGLNIQGSAFGTLLSGGGEKKTAPLFGQQTNLAAAGSVGMGSTGFGGGATQMQGFNFNAGFNAGAGIGGQASTSGNLFMQSTTPTVNQGWMGGIGQTTSQPQDGASQTTSAMTRMRG